MRLIRFFLCGCLLCAAPIPDVFAQPAAAPPAASSAMTDKARDLYSEGVQLFRQKKWPQAEASFEAAWALAKHYSIAANLGETKLRLAKYRAAAELLAFAYRQAPATETPERKHIAGLLAEAKGKVGTLVVKTNVPGAGVTVGGKAAGETPLVDPIYVEPGSVTIRVYCDGYASQEKTLDLQAGQEVALNMTLERPTAPVATVTASPTTAATVPTVAVNGPRTELVVGGAAVAGAVVIVGGVLFGIAEKTRGELRADTPKNPDGSFVCAKQTAPGTAAPTCDELRGRTSTGTTFGQAGIGLLVTGGLIGLGTVGYALFWPRPKKAPTSSLLPVATPQSAGLVWTGSF